MIIVLMGVSGAGKTTVGRLLAADLGWPFYDGDDFHSAANREKMGRGEPLSEADREPWLNAIAGQIDQLIEQKRSAVFACSALKQHYRQRLGGTHPGVRFIYLQGTYAQIAERLRQRKGHFARENLLASQFAALEEPGEVLIVSIDRPPGEMVAEIKGKLGLSGPAKP